MRKYHFQNKHQLKWCLNPGKSSKQMSWKMSINPLDFTEQRVRFHYNIERDERLNINSIIAWHTTRAGNRGGLVEVCFPKRKQGARTQCHFELSGLN